MAQDLAGCFTKDLGVYVLLWRTWVLQRFSYAVLFSLVHPEGPDPKAFSSKNKDGYSYQVESIVPSETSSNE